MIRNNIIIKKVIKKVSKDINFILVSLNGRKIKDKERYFKHMIPLFFK